MPKKILAQHRNRFDSKSRFIPDDMTVGSVHHTKNYGSLIVTYYRNSRNVGVYFLLTGSEYTVQSSNIRNGHVSDLIERELTHHRLLEVLKYDPDTGRFTRLKSLGGLVINEASATKPNNHGYISISIDGKSYKAHRLAIYYVTGKMPLSEIDHINHIRHDNRLCNLRETTGEDNSKNQKLASNNTSGQIGISWCNLTKKWDVKIGGKGRKRIADMSDAIKHRDTLLMKYGFHENHGIQRSL